MNLPSLKIMSLSCPLKAAIIFLIINLSFSLPVPESIYSSFLADLQKRQCTLPSSISISQNKSIESSLRVCNSTEYLKYNKEVPILCQETFALYKNISCPPVNLGLDKLEFTFPHSVCENFAEYVKFMPAGLLKHLADPFTCSMLCSEDVEDACQVLLWSYLVQSKSKNPDAKAEIPAENSLPDTKSITEDNGDKTDSQLSTISKQQNSESTIADPKMNNPAVSKELTEKPLESGIKSDVTLKKDETTNELPGYANISPKEDKFTVSKAITEQTPLAIESKSETTSNSSNAKAPPVDISNTQNVNLDNQNPETISNQQSEQNSTPSPPTKTVTVTANALKPNSKPENTIKETVPNETHPELLKQDPQASQVAEEVPGEDDAKQTKPQAEVEKGEPKEIINEPPSIPKSEEKNQNLKPKVPEIPDSMLSSEPSAVSDSNLKEASSSPASSVSVTPSLEKMEDEIPLPNEKDADQYTDMENGDGDMDGEYSKQEYGDNGMYEPSKNKEPISESPKTVVVPKEPVVSERDDLMDFNRNPLIPSRDSFGRGSEEIQVLATFPEEDGHFFFYLLTIVLIFMAGYLVFHNKQKIIALIVEGRHERRRRSHGLGYRKLETK